MLTLTSPVDLLVSLLAASLMPMPTSSMQRIAPPAHSRGVFRCENWLIDGREENKSPNGGVSTVTLLLMNFVSFRLVASSSQCCSRIVMRWWGKWISLVSLDLSDTDEQLNFSEVSLHVIGSSNLVREEMVQFVVIQLSSFGQDSADRRWDWRKR